jgi:hypothetical protein
MLPGIMLFVIQLVTVSSPNNACSRQVGLGAFFKPLSGFEFFRLPSRVSARPLAANASRWAADVLHERLKEKESVYV